MAASSTNNLKLAEKGVWVSIIAYIVLSIGQIAFAAIVHSSALQANGFNNVTDIMGNIAILIGLRLARIPADSDHVYGHWKIESIASLISSFIMFFVGFEVLRETVMTLLSGKEEAIDHWELLLVYSQLLSCWAFIFIIGHWLKKRIHKHCQQQVRTISLMQ